MKAGVAQVPGQSPSRLAVLLRAFCLLVSLSLVSLRGEQTNLQTTGELAYLDPRTGLRELPERVPDLSGKTNPNSLGRRSFFQCSHLTGDWAGKRSKLESHGLAAGGTCITDASGLFDGGRNYGSAFRARLDFTVVFDPGPALGIQGGSFLAQYYLLRGDNGSDHMGCLQPYSNIDAESYSRWAEVWYEQRLFRDSVRLKVGHVDANAEFALVNSAAGFINSSAGFSPAIQGLPTYPEPALSLNVFAYPARFVHVGGGVYGGNLCHLSRSSLGHPYWLGQAGLNHFGNGRLGSGRIAAGVWHNTAVLDRFDGGSREGASGFFGLVEQQVWKERGDEVSDLQGLNLFAQCGWADASIAAVERHIGVGVSSLGLLPGRAEDSAGIYWTWAAASRALGSPHERDEWALEFYYSLQLTPFFALKPDLQYYSHPGGRSSPSQAWVATLRMTINL